MFFWKVCAWTKEISLKILIFFYFLCPIVCPLCEAQTGKTAWLPPHSFAEMGQEMVLFSDIWFGLKKNYFWDSQKMDWKIRKWCTYKMICRDSKIIIYFWPYMGGLASIVISQKIWEFSPFFMSTLGIILPHLMSFSDYIWTYR